MPRLTDLGRMVSEFGTWLARIPGWLFTLIALTIFFAKSIVVWRLELLGDVAERFPVVEGFGSSNFVGIALYRAIGGSPALYAALAGLALAAAVVIIWRAGGADQARSRTFLLLALSWPLLLADLAWLGNGFEFLALFVALAVLTQHRALWVTGALLAALTHPEQAFLAFASLGLLSLGQEFRYLRSRALAGAISAAIVGLASTVWLSLSGADSRTTFFFDWLVDSLVLFFRNAALLIYSGWGLWWLLLLVVFASVTRRTRWLLVLTALAVPAAMTATTIDGTRVFAGVASAVGLALIAFLRDQRHADPTGKLERDQQDTAFLGITFLAFVILPNIQVIMWAEVLSPGTSWIDLFRLWFPG